MASTKNAPKKNAPKNQEPQPKEKPSGPKVSFAFLDRLNPLHWIPEENRGRVTRILGLFLVVFGVYLVIACVSHFFAGREDQSLVQQGPLLPVEQAQAPSNRAGAIGAYLAEMIIGSGFGFVGLLVPVLIILLGLRLWDSVYGKWLETLSPYLTFTTLWISAVFGFATVTLGLHSPDWGGAFGKALTLLLAHYLGLTGMAILLAFAFLTFVILKPARIPDLRRLAKGVATKLGSDEDNLPQPVGVETPQSTLDVAMHRAEVQEPDQEPETDDELEGGFIVSVRKTHHPLEEEKLASNVPLSLEVHTKHGGSPSLSGTPPVGFPEDGVYLPSFEVNMVPKDPDTFVKDILDEDLESLDEDEVLADLTEYDPKLQLSRYQYPTIDLLRSYESTQDIEVSRAELEANKNRIVRTLQNYSIEITKISATVGPTVTLYEIVPAPGVRINKIRGLEDDIALSLSAQGIRIIAPIPGKGTIGIEIPNEQAETVSLRSVLATEKFRDTKAELPIAIGKTIANEVYIADLAKMPHLLVAGATGQGKSVGLNCIIASLLYKKHPAQIKFVLIDPKKVEMALYQLLERHFLAKLPNYPDAIITDTRQVVHVLTSLCMEMDDRYELLKSARVRNLKEYNAKFVSRRLNPKNGHRYMPYIVLVIDELADLMLTAGKEVEMPLARLAQLARAVGIHLVVATQRPSVNVITGVIKANFPYRLSYKVAQKTDSRTILDANGADQLIGRGDLLLSTGSDILRIQNAFIDTPEVEALVEWISQQQGYPEPYYLPEVHDPEAEDDMDLNPDELDPLFFDAARLVVNSQQGSTSMLQRKYSIGYNRAGRLMDQLARAGVVGEARGSKPRDVLIADELQLEQLLGELV